MSKRHNIISRLTMTAVKVVKYSVLTGVLFLSIFGAWSIYGNMTIHQFKVRCHGFSVYFKGQKTHKFIDEVTRLLQRQEEPYVIENGRVYTTMEGAHYEQTSKIVRYLVHPEWFRKSPVFENEEQERIVTAWNNQDQLSISGYHKAWCHFVEAAISKDGIDAEARRKHPRIWPPDKWHIPAE